MAVRTPLAFRVHANKREKTAGRALNSEGAIGKAIGAEKAKWVLYQGPIGEQNYAVAMFDHPEDFRHRNVSTTLRQLLGCFSFLCSSVGTEGAD